MECRSTERRQWIVNKYDVVPVSTYSITSKSNQA